MWLKHLGLTSLLTLEGLSVEGGLTVGGFSMEMERLLSISIVVEKAFCLNWSKYLCTFLPSVLSSISVAVEEALLLIWSKYLCTFLPSVRSTVNEKGPIWST